MSINDLADLYAIGILLAAPGLLLAYTIADALDHRRKEKARVQRRERKRQRTRETWDRVRRSL